MWHDNDVPDDVSEEDSELFGFCDIEELLSLSRHSHIRDAPDKNLKEFVHEKKEINGASDVR